MQLWPKQQKEIVHNFPSYKSDKFYRLLLIINVNEEYYCISDTFVIFIHISTPN